MCEAVQSPWKLGTCLSMSIQLWASVAGAGSRWVGMHDAHAEIG